jgi:hypothetical protein
MVFWASWNFNRDPSCSIKVYSEIFTDICGKSSMSDELEEILPSPSGEIFMGKKPHSLEWNSPFTRYYW